MNKGIIAILASLALAASKSRGGSGNLTDQDKAFVLRFYGVNPEDLNGDDQQKQRAINKIANSVRMNKNRKKQFRNNKVMTDQVYGLLYKGLQNSILNYFLIRTSSDDNGNLTVDQDDLGVWEILTGDQTGVVSIDSLRLALGKIQDEIQYFNANSVPFLSVNRAYNSTYQMINSLNSNVRELAKINNMPPEDIVFYIDATDHRQSIEYKANLLSMFESSMRAAKQMIPQTFGQGQSIDLDVFSRKVKEFDIFGLSRPKEHSSYIREIELPTDIMSGIEGDQDGRYGLIEKIRYQSDFQKHPLAFVLYVRTMLGLGSDMAIYDRWSYNIGSSMNILRLINFDNEPFKIDPSTGYVSEAILFWANQSMEKLELLNKFANQLATNNDGIFQEFSTSLGSFMDQDLANKLLKEWTQSEKRMSHQILADLHLLVLGFFVKMDQLSFLEAPNNIYFTNILLCDAGMNDLSPFGYEGFESYSRRLAAFIGGDPAPHDKSWINFEEVDELGVHVSMTTYAVSTDTWILYTGNREVFDATVRNSTCLDHEFSWDDTGRNMTELEFTFSSGQRGHLSIDRNSVIATTDGDKDFYFNMPQSYVVTRDSVKSRKYMDGISYSASDLNINTEYNYKNVKYLNERLSSIGYWISRISLHLYRFMSSGQRSMALYLMSPIIKPGAIDVAVGKYKGLIDPEVIAMSGAQSDAPLLSTEAERQAIESVLTKRHYNAVGVYSKFKSMLEKLIERFTSTIGKSIKTLKDAAKKGLDQYQIEQAIIAISESTGLNVDQIEPIARDLIIQGELKFIQSKKISDQEKTNQEIELINRNFPGYNGDLSLRSDIERNGERASNTIKSAFLSSIKNEPLITLMRSIGIFPYSEKNFNGYQNVDFNNMREPYKPITIYEGQGGFVMNQSEVASFQNGPLYKKSAYITPQSLVLSHLPGSTPSEVMSLRAAEGVYAKNYSNLCIFADVVKSIGSRSGLFGEDLNEMTLDQFLRMSGFLFESRNGNYDVQEIFEEVSRNPQVVQQQLISHFKLNRIPYVRGASLSAYEAFLREAQNMEDDAQVIDAYKNIAKITGINIDHYYFDSNIYGQYTDEGEDKFVFNNYNSSVVPVSAQRLASFERGFDSSITNEKLKASIFKLDEVQLDERTFKKNINMIGTQSHFNILSTLVSRFNRLQLDAMQEEGRPIYLKVREFGDGNISPYSDDIFGFSLMYDALAYHGNGVSLTTPDGAQTSQSARVANPLLAMKASMTGSSLKDDQKDRMNTILGKKYTKGIMNAVQVDEKTDKIINYGDADRLRRVIIDIVGPISNHHSRRSDANRWSKSSDQIDVVKAKIYWEKLDNLALKLLEKEDVVNNLIDIDLALSNKFPGFNRQVVDWAELASRPEALAEFVDRLKNRYKNFIDLKDDRGDFFHRQQFRAQMQRIIGQNNGIVGGQYADVLDKLYADYEETLKSSTVGIQSPAVGDLAFITPNGYRVYTPYMRRHLRILTLSGSSSTSRSPEIESRLHHKVGNVHQALIAGQDISGGAMCIGTSGDTGYMTSMLKGNQIHFVGVAPNGRKIMVATFVVTPRGFGVDQIQNENNSSYIANIPNDPVKKRERVLFMREFLKGVRDWFKNPTSIGPAQRQDVYSDAWDDNAEYPTPRYLVEGELANWQENARAFNWSQMADELFGSDDDIDNGASPIFNNSYVAGLNKYADIQ